MANGKSILRNKDVAGNFWPTERINFIYLFIARISSLCYKDQREVWGNNPGTELPIIGSRYAHGDFIFRNGKRIWSPLFARANPKFGFTHVGVLFTNNSMHTFCLRPLLRQLVVRLLRTNFQVDNLAAPWCSHFVD